MMKKIKYLFIIFGVAVFAIIAVILISDNVIKKSNSKFIFNDVNEIPHNKVGLLLGTSKYVRSGQINQYFAYRIAAAVSLYNAQKIDFIVVSGDNKTKSYNEPLDMKNELMKYGIPEEKIFLDYAGFRTYDSVIRMNKIFGQTNFTIISQEFHNQRAVYIARYKKLNAIGFNAKDVSAYFGFKTQVREKFARVKVFLDLWTNKNPKFLGDTIEIE
jgi:Uncharacterized membrane protein